MVFLLIEALRDVMGQLAKFSRTIARVILRLALIKCCHTGDPLSEYTGDIFKPRSCSIEQSPTILYMGTEVMGLKSAAQGSAG